MLPETLCYGDVLLQRRFAWRRFVEEMFCSETFCMCASKFPSKTFVEKLKGRCGGIKNAQNPP
jgi:hypothetical protein